MTEVQLIEACQKQDSAAQRVLYDRYVDRLFVRCIRYVPEKADAEELLSDAFIKAFKHIGGFCYTGEGSLSAWLSRILVNECLMFLRRKKQLILPMETLPELPEHREVDTALNRLQAREILKLLQELPPGYRTVFNLHVFEDMSHKEIAALLQIAESTSKSQLFKARAMLKQKIQL